MVRFYRDNSNDEIVEMRIEDECIVATSNNGSSVYYNLHDKFNPEKIHSTRLSYMLGYIQAENLMRNTYQSIHSNVYKIIKDNITTLEVLNIKEDKTFLKKPLDILFSEEYKQFSKEDVCKIGYICGQMSRL